MDACLARRRALDRHLRPQPPESEVIGRPVRARARLRRMGSQFLRPYVLPHPASLYFLLSSYHIAAPFLRADEIELPDRPGVKISWWSYIKYFWILITRLPTFIRSRPSKAAARTTKVRSQARRTRFFLTFFICSSSNRFAQSTSTQASGQLGK